jgi:uncharacterized protein
MNRRASTLALVLALALPVALGALELPPKPSAWVTDGAKVIDPAREQQLNEKLEAFYVRSGSQFLVFTYPSLEGESLEDFSIRLAEQWKVKGDRALILLVFVDDRKVRVEVGYGLEGAITDAVSSRVIREQIAPAFRRGDYAGGIEAALDRLIGVVEGSEQPIAPEGSSGGDIGALFPLIFLVFLFFILLPAISRRGGCGCLPLLFLAGSGGRTYGGRHHGGGWSSGGGRGGGWSVGGGWGGGGGGSFGGGGASGSW